MSSLCEILAVSCLRMRFRAKFGIAGWSQIALVCLIAVLWLSGVKSLPALAFGAIIFASVIVLSQVFVYWDLDSHCLRERRLWGKRQVPWEEVTRVSAWNEKPSSDFLAIHYSRRGPMSDDGSIIANPQDRQQFLVELHRYAPQAVFDV
jgi:hypothetical protein